MGEDDVSGDEPQASLNFFKKNWKYILLFAIIIFGFYLRSYHAGYPAIGYHNWKETHYLTEARNFAEDGFFKYGFFVPYTDYPIGPDPRGIHPDTFPTTSILVGLAFKFFGANLWLARMIVILFSTATIFAMYLFAKKLFNREDFGLLAAALFAINPLFVFFGRQVQLDAPALFFMILSGYFFLKWRENDKSKYLILTSALLTVATLTKYTYFVLGVPMLLTFPLSRLKEWKIRWKTFAIAIAITLLVPLWMLYMSTVPGEYGLKEAVSGETVRFGTLISAEFWTTMRAYAADNYTLTGVVLAVLGLLLAIAAFRKNFGNKFMTYFFLGSLIWFFVLSYKLSGHSYHQYPIAPLVVLAIAYLFLVVGASIEKIIGIKHSKWALFAIFVFLLAIPSAAAKNRQFDTQFFGLDVAGGYIEQNSKSNELIFHSGHQSYGLHWAADRKGRSLPGDVAGIKDWEEKGAKWILLYQWGLQVMQDKERWDYIKDNYGLKQIAFQQVQGGNAPIYLLFERGGSFNESSLNQMLENKAIKTKDYELTKGNVRISYINLD